MSTHLTFLFADLEGSTGLIQRLGDDYRSLLSAYHSIVLAAVQDASGHIVTIEGDGFFCVFADPLDAVAAARRILREMSVTKWSGDEQPRCRFGIHTGPAARTDEGYVGLAVHIGARIGAAAQGGQVLVSQPVAEAVADEVAGWKGTLVELGRFELKGVASDVRLHRIDFPDLDVVVAPPRARPRTSSSIPPADRPIVGRDDDVQGATEMLLRETVRVVTLTGPGGTGKTRLALEVARNVERRFVDGVVLIDLSGVLEPVRFLPVVARALGVHESGGRSLQAALASTVGDSQMLLVLDNMEQLLPAAPQIGDLLSAMPLVKILVTSRAALRIPWEHEYPVSPLVVPLPDAGIDTIGAAAAVQLFVERAQSVRPLFDLNEVTAPVVAEVTRQLDGLPLAIELAAARLRIFTVEELRDRLDEKLEFVDKGIHGVPERHRTLRSAISWSYELLSEDQKQIFRRLSVFVGGWSLSAALDVCCDDRSEAVVIEAMEDLVAKSLVVFSVDERGRPRYRMLETLREFGLDMLREMGEEDNLRLRHLVWCRHVAERMMVVLPTPEFPVFLDEVELERFNLREALAWSARTRQGTNDALTVCGMLPLFFDTRGYVSEGLRWLRTFVAMTTNEGTTAERAMAHTSMGWLEMLAGDTEESDWALKTAVQMFRDLENDDWLGRALSMQGMTTYNMGHLDEAEEQFNEAIELCRANGIDWLADGWCNYGLAHIAMARGDHELAGQQLQGCLDFSRRLGLTWGIGHAQFSLAVLDFMMGDLDQSMRRLTESLTVRRHLRDARGLCDCLGMMALHASVGGDHHLAARLIGVAEAAREASGDSPVPWLQPLVDQAVLSATANLGDRYEEVHLSGREMSMDEAIDVVLGWRDETRDPIPAAV